MMNILIIEDSLKLAENIATVLEAEGYKIKKAVTGHDGFQKALSEVFDLIILDLNLPDQDGLKVAEELRKSGIDYPILILTARIGLEDKVEGLDKGADDYLTKPFLMDELLARIRALTRRKNKKVLQKVSLNSHITIDFSAKKVLKNNIDVSLSPTEYKILELLVENRGEAQNIARIYEKVWGYDNSDVLFSETLKVHIARLRKKLDEDLIQTVKGYGYMIE